MKKRTQKSKCKVKWFPPNRVSSGRQGVPIMVKLGNCFKKLSSLTILRTRVALCLISGFLLMSGAVAAQEKNNMPVIGVLWPDSAPSARIETFRQGMRDLGYVEGRNVNMEFRYADGQRQRLPQLAAELVRLDVDVIVALTTLAARPAKNATKTNPNRHD